MEEIFVLPQNSSSKPAAEDPNVSVQGKPLSTAVWAGEKVALVSCQDIRDTASNGNDDNQTFLPVALTSALCAARARPRCTHFSRLTRYLRGSSNCRPVSAWWCPCGRTNHAVVECHNNCPELGGAANVSRGTSAVDAPRQVRVVQVGSVRAAWTTWTMLKLLALANNDLFPWHCWNNETFLVHLWWQPRQSKCVHLLLP